jgi:hypothetical protein
LTTITTLISFGVFFYFIGNHGDDVDGTLKETPDSRHSGEVE